MNDDIIQRECVSPDNPLVHQGMVCSVVSSSGVEGFVERADDEEEVGEVKQENDFHFGDDFGEARSTKVQKQTQAPSLESNRIEETTNFEISKTTRSMIRETGEVRRLSVAVLVDGIYTENAEGERVYEPRSSEDLDQIAALVRSAIGYDAKRGDTLEVVNMQFADIEVSDTPYDNSLFGFDKNKLIE